MQLSLASSENPNLTEEFSIYRLNKIITEEFLRILWISKHSVELLGIQKNFKELLRIRRNHYELLGVTMKY